VNADDLDLVRGLVEIPSVSRHEGEAVEWLVARMAERGFRASVDDAGNAVGEIGDGPRHVVLLGHIDTVPGEIPVRMEGDELVGRGAVDAKGPLAAFVCAATAPVPGLRVTVVGAVEEESPTSKGARYRAKRAAPDWCVIGEPSGWDAVTIGYKGRLGARISLVRQVRHGAAPGATLAEEALALWERIRAAGDARTPGSTGFAKLDCRLEGITTAIGDGLTERGELRIGYRIPPGLTTRELSDELTGICRSYTGEARLNIESQAVEEPVRTSRSTPLARAFVTGIASAGGEATFKVKSGTSDMNILSPAWGCPMVAYGPGDSKYDHTPMERLALSDYQRSIIVLRTVLERAVRA
jgi:LysW-gamma-L-lysine carboxypeptidase